LNRKKHKIREKEKRKKGGFSIEWIEPVTDRVIDDVVFAKMLSDANQLEGYVNVSLKGTLNATDFNRISGNLIWAAETLAIHRFPVADVKSGWTVADFFTFGDLNNYEENIYFLKERYKLSVFYPGVDFGVKQVFGDAGSNRRRIDFEKVNQWERILFYLKKFTGGNGRTWQDAYNGFGTWQKRTARNIRWGDVLVDNQ